MSAVLARDIPDLLPEFIEAVLLGDDYFSDVPVVIINPSDTEQQILERTGPLLTKAGNCGIVVFILPVDTATDDYRNPATGPLRLTIGFQVWEMTSRSEFATGNDKTGYSIARHTFALFKNRTIGGLAKLFVSESPTIERIPPPEGKRIRGWAVNFTAQEDDNSITPKVELPHFTPRSGAATTVTLACATAGAAIYYTTDGSPPAPTAAGNTSILYTAPIVVPDAGCTLFAQATKAGHLPSSSIVGTFTKA